MWTTNTNDRSFQLSVTQDFPPLWNGNIAVRTGTLTSEFFPHPGAILHWQCWMPAFNECSTCWYRWWGFGRVTDRLQLWLVLCERMLWTHGVRRALSTLSKPSSLCCGTRVVLLLVIKCCSFQRRKLDSYVIVIMSTRFRTLPFN